MYRDASRHWPPWAVCALARHTACVLDSMGSRGPTISLVGFDVTHARGRWAEGPSPAATGKSLLPVRAAPVADRTAAMTTTAMERGVTSATMVVASDMIYKATSPTLGAHGGVEGMAITPMSRKPASTAHHLTGGLMTSIDISPSPPLSSFGVDRGPSQPVYLRPNRSGSTSHGPRLRTVLEREQILDKDKNG